MKTLYSALFFSAAAAIFSACREQTTEIEPPVDENKNTILYYDRAPSSIGAGFSETVTLDTASLASLIFEVGNLDNPTDKFARVSVSNCQILDNSSHGFPDALKLGDTITASGHWSVQGSVLGTSVGHGGNFEAKGDRYLGFRIAHTGGGYRYGWIRLNCPFGNATLTILDFAVNTTPGARILAGQKDSNRAPVPDKPTPVSGPAGIIGHWRSTPDTAGSYCSIIIAASSDPAFDFTVQFFPFMWPYPKLGGRIVDGRLVIPFVAYDGNIPSPGGTPRPYHGDFSGSGDLFAGPDGVRVEWDIDYVKTGFLAEAFNGGFLMYKCE